MRAWSANLVLYRASYVENCIISCDVKYRTAMGWHKFEIKPDSLPSMSVNELKTLYQERSF